MEEISRLIFSCWIKMNALCFLVFIARGEKKGKIYGTCLGLTIAVWPIMMWALAQYEMLVVLGIGLGVIILRFIIFTVKTLLLMKCVSYEERKEEYKAIIGCYTPIFESILGIGGAAVVFCGMLYFASFILHG